MDARRATGMAVIVVTIPGRCCRRRRGRRADATEHAQKSRTGSGWRRWAGRRRLIGGVAGIMAAAIARGRRWTAVVVRTHI